MEYCERFDDAYSVSYRDYHFTSAEIEHLQLVCAKFDGRAVYRLIRHLEFYCQDVMHILRIDPPRKSELHRDRASALNTLNKAVRLLKNMQHAKGGGAFVMDWTRSLTELQHNRAAASRREDPEFAYSKIFSLVPKAVKALEEIISTIEEQAASEEKAERGRPDADAIGLARTVAHLLNEHLEIVPTPNPEGVFATVLRICLEAVGLPCKDPSRAIRYAVESFPAA